MRFLVPIFILVAVVFAGVAGAAERPILVRVEVGDRTEVREVGRILSLDEKTRGNTLFGWGTSKDIEAVEKLGHQVEVVPPEPKNPEGLTMCREPFAAPFPWDCYPTWSQFETMMNYYAATYPDVAELVNLGMSGEGDHELWALKITDNVGAAEEENEPEVLFTGTMHGNELVCYPTSVHLIDHILANYNTDPQVARLVDETVIWINPMSNPDGTFLGGDQAVSGSDYARELPASGADANRSFPDPSVPEDPSTPGWPAEVQVMMDLAALEHFTLAANCHAGAEVFNYPWDVWSVRSPDDGWWIDAGTAYATSAHDAGPTGYLTMCPGSCPFPGVTNGYDWYTTSGNRQDFMNWYHGCREVTLELADAKDLDADLLDDHFDWNREALLGFFELALTGIRGVVTDAITGDPLSAEIRVIGHDVEEQRTWVSTDPDVGDFHRLIEAGTWDLEFRSETYQTHFEYGVVVQHDSDATVIDVQLQPSTQVAVTGVIRDGATGGGIPYATVTLTGPAVYGPIAADGFGAFRISGVWENPYTGRFEAPGYALLEREVVITAGSSHHEVYLTAPRSVYSNDFETSDGGLTAPVGWAWGSDATAGAHSGTGVWGTVLGGEYDDEVVWTLETPTIDLLDVDGAELRFWQWYKIESGGFDGGNIKIATDGGPFVLVNPIPDYDDQAVNGLGGEPGFTGNAGWHEVEVDLNDFTGHTVIIRWTLGTDYSEVRRGWYLDDLTIAVWGGDVEPPLFRDGFESGGPSAWSSVTGERGMDRRPVGTIRHPPE